jgi:hypothetical protein
MILNNRIVMTTNLWIVGLFFICSGISAQAPTKIPQTDITTMLITDGRFDKLEWQGATIKEMSGKDSVYLYLKNHKNQILLGIRCPFRMVAYIDMFVDFGSGYIHHFHSSAQIAERILTDTTWTDMEPPTHWGNAVDWYANENRNDRLKAQELLQKDPGRDRTKMLLDTTYPFQGYEYVFNKRRFNKKEWKVRIEVRTGMPGEHNVVYPVNSTRKNSAQWAMFLF